MCYEVVFVLLWSVEEVEWLSLSRRISEAHASNVTEASRVLYSYISFVLIWNE